MVKSTEYLRHWTCKKCQSKFFYHYSPNSQGFEYSWNTAKLCENCSDLTAIDAKHSIDITFAFLDTNDDYVDSSICNLLYG